MFSFFSFISQRSYSVQFSEYKLLLSLCSNNKNQMDVRISKILICIFFFSQLFPNNTLRRFLCKWNVMASKLILLSLQNTSVLIFCKQFTKASNYKLLILKITTIENVQTTTYLYLRMYITQGGYETNFIFEWRTDFLTSRHLLFIT